MPASAPGPQEIREMIKRAEMTQLEFATALGVHPGAVAKWIAEPGSPSYRRPRGLSIRVLQNFEEWLRQQGK